MGSVDTAPASGGASTSRPRLCTGLTTTIAERSGDAVTASTALLSGGTTIHRLCVIRV